MFISSRLRPWRDRRRPRRTLWKRQRRATSWGRTTGTVAIGTAGTGRTAAKGYTVDRRRRCRTKIAAVAAAGVGKRPAARSKARPWGRGRGNDRCTARGMGRRTDRCTTRRDTTSRSRRGRAERRKGRQRTETGKTRRRRSTGLTSTRRGTGRRRRQRGNRKPGSTVGTVQSCTAAAAAAADGTVGTRLKNETRLQ